MFSFFIFEFFGCVVNVQTLKLVTVYFFPSLSLQSQYSHLSALKNAFLSLTSRIIYSANQYIFSVPELVRFVFNEVNDVIPYDMPRISIGEIQVWRNSGLEKKEFDFVA